MKHFVANALLPATFLSVVGCLEVRAVISKAVSLFLEVYVWQKPVNKKHPLDGTHPSRLYGHTCAITVHITLVLCAKLLFRRCQFPKSIA